MAIDAGSGGAVRLPDFFVAGAPKAGTTSLYEYLDRHPGIYMSPLKEPCYFAAEVRLGGFDERHCDLAARNAAELQEWLNGPLTQKRFGGIVADWDDYLKLFRNAGPSQVAGEASVCYLWSETAAARIFERVPRARIVMILRDPADRAFSQYLHGLANGVVRESFGQHIRESLHRTGDEFGPLYPFLELGMYSAQVARYLETFPRENIRIYDYEEYNTQPNRVLADICGLLDVEVKFPQELAAPERALAPQVPRNAGLAAFLKSPAIKALIPARGRRYMKPLLYRGRHTLRMTPDERDLLRSYYEEDVAKLARLLDRDLSHWLRPVERADTAAAG